MKDSYKVKYLFVIVAIFVTQVIVASRFIITNDEAYYLSFAKNLQLSYVDSPPFVSYLSWLQVYYNCLQPLCLRILVIILHLVSSMFLLAVVMNNSQNNSIEVRKSIFTSFLFCYICPIFGLYGIFILPDTGLILALSIMLYVTDKIYKQQNISYIHSLILGLGFGIGLLSKYHIIPLGGGMLLGLLLSLLTHYKNNYRHLIICSLIIMIISIFISAPMWIWNWTYNFASFKFQLQHGFAKGTWSLISASIFCVSSLLFITPWIAYFLLKFGLLKNRRSYLIIPFTCLFFTLLSSSLRKNVLGHWIAPAFWILIPYASINLYKYGSKFSQKILNFFLAITFLIWVIIAIPLAQPGGMNNIKSIIYNVNKDLSDSADLLLWMDIKNILDNNQVFSKKIKVLHNQYSSNKLCNTKIELIGTTDWMFTSQFEYLGFEKSLKKQYHNPYKIINVNIEHANFYLWRDNLTAYANCPILIITYRTLPTYLTEVMTINNESIISNIPNYKNIDIHLISGTFKNASYIKDSRNKVLYSGHY